MLFRSLTLRVRISVIVMVIMILQSFISHKKHASERPAGTPKYVVHNFHFLHNIQYFSNFKLLLPSLVLLLLPAPPPRWRCAAEPPQSILHLHFAFYETKWQNEDRIHGLLLSSSLADINQDGFSSDAAMLER